MSVVPDVPDAGTRAVASREDALVDAVLARVDPRRDDVLVAVVGPTASGKTALGIALAERVDGEIVSADSVQIYRHFDVGSGKPTAEERRRAVHHLVDVVDPGAPIDAARFAELADAAVKDVRSRGKIPVLVGGTFLWVKALVQGLAAAPAADPTLRAEYDAFAKEHGRAALHGRLAVVDPVSAAKLHPNDFVRVSRALEVHTLSGRTLSDWHAEHGFRGARYRTHFVALDHEAAILDERITRRARAWLQGTWIDEVRSLHARGYGDTRAMASVGYKEVAAHVRGEIASEDLETAVVRATRTFVRRQKTWLNGVDVQWLRAD
ncbi:MAG: tRNA (adenosine(37)-N6)-dimethylallyltransferase MiaA [Polyangiaceae bacterium]